MYKKMSVTYYEDAKFKERHYTNVTNYKRLNLNLYLIEYFWNFIIPN